MSNRAAATHESRDRLSTFWLDIEFTRIVPAFTAAGIRTLLLKGPALDQLLFAGTRTRSYTDIDLLVESAGIAAAERLLAELGFRRAAGSSTVRRLVKRAGIAVRLGSAHATAWVRDRDRFTVDLHDTVPEVRAPAAETWRALNAHAVTITVVDTEVETIDRAASALLIALHAAHHGPEWTRARADLQRACEVLERDCWRDAALIARDLRAEASMGIGLGTVDAGRRVARELGLRTSPTPIQRLRWAGAAAIARRRR